MLASSGYVNGNTANNNSWNRNENEKVIPGKRGNCRKKNIDGVINII